MTSLLLLTLAVARQEPAPKPSELLSTMIARYAGARSLSGKVNHRQTATSNGKTAEHTVSTEFALERPARLRIVQKSSKYTQKSFLITSDGTEFTSDVPDLEAPPGLRLAQPAVDPSGTPTIGRLLAFSRDSLPDPGSPFLAIASAWVPDLKNLQGEWASLADGGVGEVNGAACRIVKGKWRRVVTQAPTGTFGMWITPEGDLLKYSTEEKIEVRDEDKKSLGTVTIYTEWVGSILVNPELPNDTFRVVR